MSKALLDSQTIKMRSVVLVHGIFDSGRSFRKMARFLETRGFQTFLPNLKQNTGKSGLDELARNLKTYVDDHVPSGQTFDLVGFSMGGLVSRYYLQRLEGMTRVRRFISISTPHNGSWLAYLIQNRGCRQMRPKSPFLKELNEDVHTLQRVRMVSIWTPFDLSILPPSSSHLPVGVELKLYIFVHRLMISNRQTFEAVSSFLMSADEDIAA